MRHYEEAGCTVSHGRVTGTQEQVVAAVLAMIAGRQRRSDEHMQAIGVGRAWLRKEPLDMLKDSGWGTDASGNLIGGEYEIRRIARTIDTYFGEQPCPSQI